MQRYIWLASATIVYVAALWFPHLFWWGIWIYPIGIIVAGAQYGIEWYISYIWGCVTYGLHSIGLYYGIMHMAEGPIWLRIIPSMLMIGYVALCPTTLFTLATYIQRYACSMIARVGIWMITLCVLTYLLDSSILTIFGRWEGNPLFHPTLALAHMPDMLSLLPLIGKIGYTILIMLPAALAAYTIMIPRIHHAMWVLITMTPWLISRQVHVSESAPRDHLSRITVIPIMFPHSMDIDDIMSMANSTMQMAHATYPQTETYIFPESAFHRGDMQQHASRWNTPDTTRIIYGAFSWLDTMYCNTLAAVEDGNIVYQFRKRHAMPLTERIPYLLDYPWLRNQYCHEEPEIRASAEARKPLTVLNGVSCVPYICSELFMQEYPDDDHPWLAVLFVGQDMWLRHTMSSYISDLMLAHARVRAMTWHRPIIYITYRHAYYITRSGELVELQVFA